MATVRVSASTNVQVNTKYNLPPTIHAAEKQLRLCLGLPYKRKSGGQIPYGYMYDQTLDKYIPNEELFKLLFKARQYVLTSHSLREVATWLNFKAAKIGVDAITHLGLQKIMIVRPPYEECLLPEAEKEKIIESLTKWNSTTPTLMNHCQSAKPKKLLDEE